MSDEDEIHESSILSAPISDGEWSLWQDTLSDTRIIFFVKLHLQLDFSQTSVYSWHSLSSFSYFASLPRPPLFDSPSHTPAVLCVFSFSITSVYLEKLPESVQRKRSFIVSLSASPAGKMTSTLMARMLAINTALTHIQACVRIRSYAGCMCMYTCARAHTHKHNGGRGEGRGWWGCYRNCSLSGMEWRMIKKSSNEESHLTYLMPFELSER